jgi:hypothetical protein
MASRNRLVAVFATILTWCSSTVAEDLKFCGEARYYPSEYTCFNNSILCPVAFGIANQPCNGACYQREMYQCDAGNLKLLPQATSPFVMVARSTSQNVNGQVVKACGNYLALGADARLCTSCTGPDCSTYRNKTVLLPSGEMVSQ